LILAGAFSIVLGLGIGVRQIADSFHTGLGHEGQRRAFCLYHALTILSLLFSVLVLVSVLQPLHTASNGGINRTTWQTMALAHPNRVCSYEVENRCAGHKNQTCSRSPDSSINKSCPGHFCLDTCKATTPNAMSRNSDCNGCISSTSVSLLLKCKASEARRTSSDTCIFKLRKDVRLFVWIAAISSGVAICFTSLVSILGALSPILNSRG